MNKKGVEMTIGTIVVIILALVVLVVLIYGFSTGWGNLWENILGYGGGKVNVQTVIESCRVACQTGGEYDYCTKNRSVTFVQNAKPEPVSCRQIATRLPQDLSCDLVTCP